MHIIYMWDCENWEVPGQVADAVVPLRRHGAGPAVR